MATGEPVYRETELPGAVLTRVARSHVRIGTFEYFSARQDTQALRQLADYVIARHYPEVAAAERPYQALLDAVIARQAGLVAQWLGVGFIHGVMNTDNMSIAGETIDYGPCAFMDSYHPGTVYSSIDRGGRYAYGNQPRIAQWNLSRLAQCLLPLLGEDQDKAVESAQAAIDAFPVQFEGVYLDRFRAKLGLREAHPEDADLIGTLLEAMAEQGADFTNSFRSRAAAEWLGRWRMRLAQEALEPGARAAQMRRSNPALIPRNHRVEAALEAAVGGDLGPLDDLLRVLASPWDELPEGLPYRSPPEPHEIVHQTFCGT